jgi:hypothetical protein
MLGLGLISGIIGLLLLKSVAAQSSGCAALNFSGGPIMSVTTSSHVFTAGDTITASFGVATTALNARLEIPNGTQVASGSTFGTLSYTFPADTSAAIKLMADGAGDIQFTLSCVGAVVNSGSAASGFSAPPAAPQNVIPSWSPGDLRIAPSVATGLNAYCTPNGIEVYSMTGSVSLFVPLTRILEVGIPGGNTLLASGGGLEVWRQPNTFFEIVDVFANNRRELLIVDFEDFPNRCEVRRWRRAYLYPNERFTDIYEQSNGWGDAPRQIYF